MPPSSAKRPRADDGDDEIYHTTSLACDDEGVGDAAEAPAKDEYFVVIKNFADNEFAESLEYHYNRVVFTRDEWEQMLRHFPGLVVWGMAWNKAVRLDVPGLPNNRATVYTMELPLTLEKLSIEQVAAAKKIVIEQTLLLKKAKLKMNHPLCHFYCGVGTNWANLAGGAVARVGLEAGKEAGEEAGEEASS